MIDLFWDLHQSRRINEVEDTALRTQSHSQQVRDALRRLENRIDRLTVIEAALCAIVQRRFGITEEELRAEVERIDLLDGVLDGKLRRQPSECPQCNRPNARRRDECMYCGTRLQGGDGVYGSVL